jgi:hypothetical protein
MLPGMSKEELVRFRDPEIAALATSITARLPELADELVERIRQAVDAYGPGAPVPFDDLSTTCRNHLEFLFGQLIQPTGSDRASYGTRSSKRPAGQVAVRARRWYVPPLTSGP